MAEAVAVYGGCFDPFHNVHLQLAKQALERLPVSRLLLVPNGSPPHRGVAAPWSDRVRMCELGVDGEAGLEVSLIETPDVRRKSLDTARELGQRFATQIWVVGGDAFSSLNDWIEWEALFGMVNWAVAPRDGAGDWRPSPPAAEFVAGGLVDDPAVLGEGRGRVWAWEDGFGELSSTWLRDHIAVDTGCWQEKLPQPVAAYIEKRRVYS